MSIEVVKSLNALLEDGFSQVRFRHTEKDPGLYIPPQFFIGAIPPKKKGNDPMNTERASNYPFICSRIVTGDDNADDSLVHVETVFGIYTAAEDEAGHCEIVNMVSRARRLILEKQMLAGKFEFEFPLKWSIGDPREDHAQPHPNYEGFIKTTWRMPVIQRTHTLEEEEKIYGN